MSRRLREILPADNILAVHLTRAQGKPFMDVRFFSGPRPDPAVTASSFVPASPLRAANPGPRFSQGRFSNRCRRSGARCCSARWGGDLEAGSYSTGENPLPPTSRSMFNVMGKDSRSLRQRMSSTCLRRAL